MSSDACFCSEGGMFRHWTSIHVLSWCTKLAIRSISGDFWAQSKGREEISYQGSEYFLTRNKFSCIMTPLEAPLWHMIFLPNPLLAPSLSLQPKNPWMNETLFLVTRDFHGALWWEVLTCLAWEAPLLTYLFIMTPLIPSIFLPPSVLCVVQWTCNYHNVGRQLTGWETIWSVGFIGCSSGCLNFHRLIFWNLVSYRSGVTI